MASIFSKIINGEIPSYKLGETDDYYAFLDIMPRRRGHALVIPKQETDYIFDLDEGLYTGLMLYARKVGGAIEKEVECDRIGIAVVGLEVPHAHVHLIPIEKIDDFGFHNPPLKMKPEEFKELASRISAHLE